MDPIHGAQTTAVAAHNLEHLVRIDRGNLDRPLGKRPDRYRLDVRQGHLGRRDSLLDDQSRRPNFEVVVPKPFAQHIENSPTQQQPRDSPRKSGSPPGDADRCRNNRQHDPFGDEKNPFWQPSRACTRKGRRDAVRRWAVACSSPSRLLQTRVVRHRYSSRGADVRWSGVIALPLHGGPHGECQRSRKSKGTAVCGPPVARAPVPRAPVPRPPLPRPPVSRPPICRSPVWHVGRKDAFFATPRAGIAVTQGHHSQQRRWGTRRAGAFDARHSGKRKRPTTAGRPDKR